MVGKFFEKISGRTAYSGPKSQTGKYVVRAEDLPRASELPCAQRPMKRAEFEKMLENHAISYGETMQG